MSVSVSYNSSTLAPLGKIVLGGSDRTILVSFNFSSSAGALNSLLDTLKKPDASLVITAGSWSKTYSIATNATKITPSIEKPGDTADSDSLKVMRLSVTVELATSFTDGFAEWVASLETDEREAHALTITGVVTGNTSGSSAVAAYDAGIEAVVDLAIGYFDIAAINWEPAASVLSPARNDRMLQFVYRQVERLEQYNAGVATYDAQVVNAQWSVMQAKTSERGSIEEQWQYAIDWSAKFPLARSEAAAYTTWQDVLRSMIVAKLTTVFSESRRGSLVVIENGFSYNPTSRLAAGRLSLHGVERNIVQYSEQVSVGLSNIHAFEKTMDGRALVGVCYAAGATGVLNQVVVIRKRNVVPTFPGPPAVGTIGGEPVVLYPREVVSTTAKRFIGEPVAGGLSPAVDYQCTFTASYWMVRQLKARNNSFDTDEGTIPGLELPTFAPQSRIEGGGVVSRN